MCGHIWLLQSGGWRWVLCVWHLVGRDQECCSPSRCARECSPSCGARGVLPILQCTGAPPTSFPILWGRETLLCAACKCWKWLGCCHLPDPRFKFCSIKLMYHLMVDHSCWVIWPLVVIFCLFQTYYLIIKCLDFNRWFRGWPGVSCSLPLIMLYLDTLVRTLLTIF